MELPTNAVSNVALAVHQMSRNLKLRKVTSFESPKLTIKVTRRHKATKRDRTQEFVVTVGAPNYEERKKIKTYRTAEEPFPVKKLSYKFTK